MQQSCQEAVRILPLTLVRSDPREAAVEFLRRQLSEEVLDQFREVVRAEALDALDCVVGKFVQQMLRAHGFSEEELGVESLQSAWHDLIRRAVA